MFTCTAAFPRLIAIKARIYGHHGQEVRFLDRVAYVTPPSWEYDALAESPERVAAVVMASTRRLAAILAADVAGYSRLMGADEEGTLERLKAHRGQLIDPKITEHHGRIVKTTARGSR
jgi:class 3 adenylate cyclase